MKKLLEILFLSLLITSCGYNMNEVQQQNSNFIILTNDPWTEFKGSTEYKNKLHKTMASNHCGKFGKFAFKFSGAYQGSRTEGVLYHCFDKYVSTYRGQELRWTNYKNNQQASNDLTSTINQNKKKCIEMGFKENSEKLAECVLRLVEIDTAKQNNQLVKQKNAEAGLAAALQSIANSTNSSSKSVMCFKTGEETGGFNKICRYNCLGNLVTKTVGSAQMCPIQIQR
jgi:hypothetical protein